MKMADEQQHLQRQQQQQQQQQQHINAQTQNNNNNNNKAIKDNNNTSNSNSESTATTTTPPRKSNIHEMRNQEYVSRLMAATPPYLYSAPVGPNNFFFSDMLRSLVQARNNETARNLQLQQAALSRRPRKRAWSQPHRAYYEQQLRERKEAEERHQLSGTTHQTNEKPLELTTQKPYFHLAQKYRKIEETTKELGLKELPNLGISKMADNTEATILGETTTTIENTNNNSVANVTGGGGAVEASMQNNTPPAASLPPQDLVLPPPPPVWYPPLYPPYGIDPLHFFIDLRVSGHIYDRKKDNVSPLTSGNENNTTNTGESDSSNPTAITLPNKHRHGSAFTVPVPRSNECKSVNLHNPNDAINLSSNTMASKFEHYAKYYDLGESKENQPFLKSNASASYMLQHLPRLYSQFAARDLIGQHIGEHGLGNNNNNNNNIENLDNIDSKSDEADCDADSTDGRISNDAVDVEIIDSIKYRNNGDVNDGDSSRCSSGDDASITQID